MFAATAYWNSPVPAFRDSTMPAIPTQCLNFLVAVRIAGLLAHADKLEWNRVYHSDRFHESCADRRKVRIQGYHSERLKRYSTEQRQCILEARLLSQLRPR